MSPGELDKLVSAEETNFLTLCRNCITGLESSDMLKRIEISRKAKALKNKQDRSEFLGKELPDLSVLLPKVFDCPKVQVKKNCKIKNISNKNF